jgi:hypothetical protein
MKTTSLLILVGSLLFLTASFSPISRVHMEPTAAGKLAIIEAEPNAWLFAQVLYTLGALVTAAGLGRAAFYFRRQAPAALSYAVILLLAAGTLLFTAYVYFRTSNPQAWVQIIPPHPLFLGYSFVMQIGLVLFGVLLLKSGVQRWLSWVVSGSMVLLLVLTIIFADMPPFAYYLLALLVGIVLIRKYRQPAMVQAG